MNDFSHLKPGDSVWVEIELEVTRVHPNGSFYAGYGETVFHFNPKGKEILLQEDVDNGCIPVWVHKSPQTPGDSNGN